MLLKSIAVFVYWRLLPNVAKAFMILLKLDSIARNTGKNVIIHLEIA